MAPPFKSSELLPNLLGGVHMIATDMDGTLTRQGRFSAALLEALEALQAADIPVLMVTGRSAGWVNGIVSYLPLVGAIAENGGLFFSCEDSYRLIPEVGNLSDHRQRLATVFQQLKTTRPHLQEALDNAFRFTDWTFDVRGLSEADLIDMQHQCEIHGWSLTYSNVQCHIKLAGQSKATALRHVLDTEFPDISPQAIVTVGDSLNDESLFEKHQFPRSVGVANIRHVSDRLHHKPQYMTPSPEVDGFCELVRAILAAQA